jgi:predicted nucleic acid-binding protein
MIFLDANIFLRYLTQPSTPEAERMQGIAAALFEAIERGDEEAMTTEVVLHEVCYLLASKKHYGLTWVDVADYLTPLVRLPGLKFNRGERRIYLRALEIAAANRKLEFADSVIAARCEGSGHQLATFDERLAAFPGIERWQFLE